MTRANITGWKIPSVQASPAQPGNWNSSLGLAMEEGVRQCVCRSWSVLEKKVYIDVFLKSHLQISNTNIYSSL